jgi:hypothetical protein
VPQAIEKTRARGKIPRTEWRAIATRHARGESLARIARDYSCTAPAIRYIVQQENASATESELPHQGSQDPQAEREPEGQPAGSGSPGVPTRFDFRLREAMTIEISAFLVALDDAIGEGKAGAFQRLREATDRLLRAAARIRIELERPATASSGRNVGSPAGLSRHSGARDARR